MALLGPAWQSSVSEQVSSETLPGAVALNGISYNIARSVGPAVGGLIVATAGAVAAFVLNALLFLPLIVTLFLWRRMVKRLNHRACLLKRSAARWSPAYAISPIRHQLRSC